MSRLLPSVLGYCLQRLGAIAVQWCEMPAKRQVAVVRACPVNWRLSFRFVRHLPGLQDEPAHNTDLRAGVGQASREEAAANEAMRAEHYGDWRG